MGKKWSKDEHLEAASPSSKSFNSPLRSVVCRSTSSALSDVSQVSAGSVVQRCAGGGSWCVEQGRGAPASVKPGRCTEVRGCSVQRRGIWPPPSAASPPSSGQHSLSPGSRSPAKQPVTQLFSAGVSFIVLPLFHSRAPRAGLTLHIIQIFNSSLWMLTQTHWGTTSKEFPL